MATSNRIRSLNRLPFDFEDGIKIKGVDVTDLDKIFTLQGASYVGFTPSNGVTATNTQDAISHIAVELNNLVDQTNGITGSWYGPFPSDPLTRPNGDPIQKGDTYYNETLNRLRTYNGITWVYDNFNVLDSNSRKYKIGTTPGTYSGQTVFTGLDLFSQSVNVFYNGSRLYYPDDYSYNANSITLTAPCVIDDIVIIDNFEYAEAVIDGGTYP